MRSERGWHRQRVSPLVWDIQETFLSGMPCMNTGGRRKWGVTTFFTKLNFQTYIPTETQTLLI